MKQRFYLYLLIILITFSCHSNEEQGSKKGNGKPVAPRLIVIQPYGDFPLALIK